MTTLQDVCDAIANTVGAAIDDLETYSIPQGTMSYPALLVLPPDIDNYQRAMAGNGAGLLHIRVWLLVAAQVSDEAIRQIVRLIDPYGDENTSIPVALQVDNTLGGVLDTNQTNVVSFRWFNTEEVNDIGYFGGEFIVDAIW